MYNIECNVRWRARSATRLSSPVHQPDAVEVCVCARGCTEYSIRPMRQKLSGGDAEAYRRSRRRRPRRARRPTTGGGVSGRAARPTRRDRAFPSLHTPSTRRMHRCKAHFAQQHATRFERPT